MTPLDQLRLRLPAHDFDRLMQAAKPVAEPTAMPCLRTSRRNLASTKWSDPACYIGSSAKCSGAMISLTSAALPDDSTEPSPPHLLTRMPLSPEQETICERLDDGEADPRAAALIRQQAQEIDDLWDRLSRAYALVRRESQQR